MQQIENTYKLTEELKYTNLHDAVYGAYDEAKKYTNEQVTIISGAVSGVAGAVNEVKQEIEGAYQLTENLKYTNLGDAVRGALTTAQAYTDNAISQYEAFTIEIVNELPSVGEDFTFYLIPKETGNGYAPCRCQSREGRDGGT